MVTIDKRMRRANGKPRYSDNFLKMDFCTADIHCIGIWDNRYISMYVYQVVNVQVS